MENRPYETVEIPANVPGVGYTLKHRKAVAMLIDYHCTKAVGKTDGNGVLFTSNDLSIMKNRAKCHDMDKVLTSLSYPQLTADYFHRMFNGHHPEGVIEINQKSKYDWIEMIFDWESSAYTKPDKGMSAYEFATTRQQHLLPYVMPYLQLFGFTEIEANRVLIQDIVKEARKPVYETDLIDAILCYIHTTHIHLLEYISRIDDVGYMQTFNAPAPFRHPSTQAPNGTLHQRPNAYVSHSNSLARREFVQGTLEAQIYDLDKICKIPVSEIPSLNARGRMAMEQMFAKGGYSIQR